MIDQATVDRIHAAANIAEVVGDFVVLKKKGINYQACCPFHNEKTPSFVVSPAKGMFKCFGCGKGGNAVTFVMEHENMTYVDALKYVARKYGIEVQEREQTPEDIKKNDDRESMMVLSSFAGDYFKDVLYNTPEGENVGLGYFRERGFSDATVEKFQLGYCPADGGSFSKAALKAGYSEEFAVRTGLSIKRDDGSLYDRFSGRVIFPIHSVSGRTIAFGGRTLRTDKKVAKYLNSPESEIYHKSDVLYGLFFAKKAITQNDCCILVEGYTDVISMHQSGVENVVASSGTSLTEGQIKLISRFSKNITVIYDGDSAGIKASLRGIDMILREGLNVRVVLLPPEDDPDSFAKKHTASELRDYIAANEQDFLTFKAKLLLDDAAGDPIKRAALISDMVESISVIPDAIVRDVFIKECGRLMDVDDGLLKEEVRRKRKNVQFSKQEREFFDRRQALDRESQQPPVDLFVTPSGVAGVGSSIVELEREIITYLLRYGRKVLEFGRGDDARVMSVAAALIEELRPDGIVFSDATLNTIYVEYLAIYDQMPDADEDSFPLSRLSNHSDRGVCLAVVDIIMKGESWKPSKLWERAEIVVREEEDNLEVAVPKAVTLYKSKIVEQMISQLRGDFGRLDSWDEQSEVLRQIAHLNEVRIKISERYSRLIL